MVGILSFLAVASAIAFVVAVLLLVVRSEKTAPEAVRGDGCRFCSRVLHPGCLGFVHL